MNICVVYSTHAISIDSVPSVPRFLAFLVKKLKSQDEGFNFYVACPKSTEKENYAQFFDIGRSYTEKWTYRQKVKIFRRLGLRRPKGRADLKRVKKFFYRIPNPDVIICTKISDIEVVHQILPKSKIVWWHLGIDNFIEKDFQKAISRSDLIVYTGQVTYQYVYNKIMPKAFPTPVMISHGPYDIEKMDRFLKNHDRSKSRIQLNYSEDEILILHVGGNRPDKGFSIILRSVSLLPSVDKKIKLISIGHGRDEELTLNNGIILQKVGIIDLNELYKYYLICDIGLVAPVSKEPGPAVFMELLYFNTITIAGVSAGIPEMIGDNKNAAILIKNPNDIIEWAEKIELVVSNIFRYKEISIEGRCLAEKFLSEKVIDNWCKVLKSLNESKSML